MVVVCNKGGPIPVLMGPTIHPSTVHAMPAGIRRDRLSAIRPVKNSPDITFIASKHLTIDLISNEPSYCILAG
jgi:hypothetical protein